MKTKQYLFILLAGLSLQSTVFAQSEAGHGGRVLKCLQPDGTQTYQLADFSENKYRWHLNIDLEEGSTYEQKVITSLERLRKVDPIRAYLYEESFKTFDDRSIFLDNYSLDLRGLKPYFFLGSEKNCETLVLVNQKPGIKLYSRDITSKGLTPEFWVATDLKNDLLKEDPKTLAATYQHELVYEEVIRKNEIIRANRGSNQPPTEIGLDDVMMFNSYISSSEFGTQHFGSYDYNQMIARDTRLGYAELVSNNPVLNLVISRDFGINGAPVSWTAEKVTAATVKSSTVLYRYSVTQDFDEKGNLTKVSGTDGALYYLDQSVKTTGDAFLYSTGGIQRVKTTEPLEVDYNGTKIKVQGWLVFSEKGKLVRASLVEATSTLPIGAPIIFADQKNSLFENTIVLPFEEVADDAMIVIVQKGNDYGFRLCKISDLSCSVIGEQEFYSRHSILKHARIAGAGDEFQKELNRRRMVLMGVEAGALIVGGVAIPGLGWAAAFGLGGGILQAGITAAIVAVGGSGVGGFIAVPKGIATIQSIHYLQGKRSEPGTDGVWNKTQKIKEIGETRFAMKKMLKGEHQVIANHSKTTEEMSNELTRRLHSMKD